MKDGLIPAKQAPNGKPVQIVKKEQRVSTFENQETDESLRKKHAEHFPVSVYEAADFYRWSQRFIMAVTIGMVTMSYGLSAWLMRSPEAFSQLSSAVAFLHAPLDSLGFADRYKDLASFDSKSNIAYLATYTVGSVFYIPALIMMVSAYNKFVLKKNKAIPMGKNSVNFLFSILLFSVIVFFVIYLWDLNISGSRYLGSTRLMLWPTFPFLGSLAFSVLLIMGFAVVGTFLKTYSMNRR